MKSRDLAALRAALIASLRGFFDSRGYLEVDTPLLVPALIPEPYIEVFETAFHDPAADGQARPLYLIPSPEVRMKRLLAHGYGDMYQLSHCFRNHESVGPQHSPEFTMLEWYTTEASHLESADLVDELLPAVAAAVITLPGADPSALSACRLPAERLSVAEAFERYAAVPAEAFVDAAMNGDALREAARSAGLRTRPDESADDLFQRFFLTHVEPELPADRPVILTDYPASVPTLAERLPGSPFARRWELYVCGMELANCYAEERDRELLQAYLDHAAGSKSAAVVPHPTDASLLEFSAAPPCSGVALGVDRLLMAVSGARDIREVIF